MSANATSTSKQAGYLAGEQDGTTMPVDQRAALDRIRHQLASEEMWTGPSTDAKSRLLEAAAAQPAEPETMLEEPSAPIRLRPMNQPSRPSAGVRHRVHRRGIRFGTAVLAAAAMAAIGFVSVGQLTAADDGPATVASYELAATPLDSDAIATVDIKPTVAGVEIELQLKGLDNAEGPDYYSAWLSDGSEAIPLGSFHWRAGGVPIVLWSGVDDAGYNTILITKQTQGDDGLRSDQVVLMGTVTSLTE